VIALKKCLKILISVNINKHEYEKGNIVLGETLPHLSALVPKKRSPRPVRRVRRRRPAPKLGPEERPRLKTGDFTEEKASKQALHIKVVPIRSLDDSDETKAAFVPFADGPEGKASAQALHVDAAPIKALDDSDEAKAAFVPIVATFESEEEIAETKEEVVTRTDAKKMAEGEAGVAEIVVEVAESKPKELVETLAPDLLALVRKHPRQVTKRILSSVLREDEEFEGPLSTFLTSHLSEIGSWKLGRASMPGRLSFPRIFETLDIGTLRHLGDAFFTIYNSPSCGYSLRPKLRYLMKMCFIHELGCSELAKSVATKPTSWLGQQRSEFDNPIYLNALRSKNTRIMGILVQVSMTNGLSELLPDMDQEQLALSLGVVNSYADAEKQANFHVDIANLACRTDRVFMLTILHESGVEIRKLHTGSFVFLATSNSSIGVLHELKRVGLDMNIQQGGQTALEFVAKRSPLTEERIRTAETLLELGVDLKANAHGAFKTILKIKSPRALPLISIMLRHGADPNIRTYGEPVLIYFAEQNDIPKVELLLQYKAKVDLTDRSGETAFMNAVDKNFLELAQLLFESGADINLSSPGGDCALYFALDHAREAPDREPMLHFLLEKGVKIPSDLFSKLKEYGFPAHLTKICEDTQIARERDLIRAINKKDLELTKKYLAFVDANKFLMREDHHPLYLAAKTGWVEGLELFLAAGAELDTKVELDPLEEDICETAFQVAVQSGHIDAAELLLRRGAKIDSGEITALHIAASAGQVPMMEFLMGHGGEVVINSFSSDGKAPIHFAAKGGHRGALDFLLAKGEEVDAKDRSGNSAVMWAIAGDQLEMCQHLVALGADIRGQARDGKTAVHALALHKPHSQEDFRKDAEKLAEYSGVLDFLLSQGLDIDAVDSHGETVLSKAAATNNLVLVRALLDKGANILKLKPSLSEVEKQSSNPRFTRFGRVRETYSRQIISVLKIEQAKRETSFIAAIEKKNLGELQRLLQFIKISEIVHKRPVLGLAVELDWAEGVVYLLDNGASIEEVPAGRAGADGNFGLTPIQRAVNNENRIMLDLLHKRGAVIGLAENSETCLNFAVMRNSIPMLEQLVAMGADLYELIPGPTEVKVSILHFSLSRFRQEVFDYLVNVAGMSLAVKDESGANIFHYIVRNGYVDRAEEILKREELRKKYDIHALDNNGRSALHLAIMDRNNSPEKRGVAELLLKNEFDLDSTDEEGITAFGYAAISEEHGHLDLVRFLLGYRPNLLRMHPLGLEAEGIPRETQEILAQEQKARQARFLEMVSDEDEVAALEMLPYVDIYSADEEGRTALQVAYKSGKLALARKIISPEADLPRADLLMKLLRPRMFGIFVLEVLATSREEFISVVGVEEGLLDLFLCNQEVIYHGLDYPAKLRLVYETAVLSRFALTPAAQKEVEVAAGSGADTGAAAEVDIADLMSLFADCEGALGAAAGAIGTRLDQMVVAVLDTTPIVVQKYSAATSANHAVELAADSRELSRYYSKIRTNLGVYIGILRRMSISERTSVFRALAGHEVFRDGSIYYDVLLGNAVSEVAFSKVLADGEEYMSFSPGVSVGEKRRIKARSLEGIGRAGVIISGKSPLTSTPKGGTVTLEIYYRDVLINYAQILDRLLSEPLQDSAPVVRDLGEALKNCGARIADAAQQTLAVVSGEVKSGTLVGRLQMVAQIERNAAFEEAVAIVTNSGAGGINTHNRLIYLRLSLELGLGIQGASVAAYRDRAVDELTDARKLRFMQVFWQQYKLQRVYSGATKYLQENIGTNQVLQMQVEEWFKAREYSAWLEGVGSGWEEGIQAALAAKEVWISSTLEHEPVVDIEAELEGEDDDDPFVDDLEAIINSQRGKKKQELFDQFQAAKDAKSVRERLQWQKEMDAELEATRARLKGRSAMIRSRALQRIKNNKKGQLQIELYKAWLKTEKGKEWLARFKGPTLFSSLKRLKQAHLFAGAKAQLYEGADLSYEAIQSLLEASGLIIPATARVQVLSVRALLIQALKTENRGVILHLLRTHQVVRDDIPRDMRTPEVLALLVEA
jgi:ankyrin repeat protein